MEWLRELDREAVRPEIDPKADCRLRILSDSEPVFNALDERSSGSIIRACLICVFSGQSGHDISIVSNCGVTCNCHSEIPSTSTC